MSPSKNTTPEARADKNGKVVTRHVNPNKGTATEARGVPAPSSFVESTHYPVSPAVAEVIERNYPEPVDNWFGQKDSLARRLDRAIHDAELDGDGIVAMMNSMVGKSNLAQGANPVPKTKSEVEEIARSISPNAEVSFDSYEDRWVITIKTDFVDGYIMSEAMRDSPAGRMHENNPNEIDHWLRKNGQSAGSFEEGLQAYNYPHAVAQYQQEFKIQELERRGLLKEHDEFLAAKDSNFEIGAALKEFYTEYFDGGSELLHRMSEYVTQSFIEDRDGYIRDGLIARPDDLDDGRTISVDAF